MFSFYLENSKINVVEISCGEYTEDIIGHSHGENAYELHYISSGVGKLVTKCGEYELSRGTFYITGPEIYHRQIPSRDIPPNEISIYLYIADKKDTDSVVNAFVKNSFMIIDASLEIRNLFNEITKYNDDKALSNVKASALISLLICEIVKDENINDSYKINDINESRSLIIENEFIFYADNTSLEKLSRKLGVCPRQAQRLIKREYGVTFSKKRSDAQHEMALTLIENTDLSIAKIASNCGYYDTASFSKSFKKREGITPSKYRLDRCN